MRKNILIVSHTYGVPFIESCNQYTQLFDKAHYAVTVVYLTGKPQSEIRQKTEAENVIFFNCSNSAMRGLKLGPIRSLLSLCKKNNYSMVICHRYKAIYAMLWVALFCRIPKLIFVLHALGTMRALPRKLLVAALARKNMFFAGVSDATRDDLRRNMWRITHERIVTLPNILDYQLFEPRILSREQARKELNIPENTFVFGNIGRCVKEKDQKTLLKAFAQFKQHYQHAQLYILGDGRIEEELKQLAKELGLANDVIFTGFIRDGFRLIKAFDALVHCAIEEAFGRVLLEAMAARTPIIATRADGIPEVVGDAGYLVAPSQPDQLAAAMIKMFQLSQIELTRMTEKGYQRMLNHFSIEAFKKNFWQPLVATAKETII